jgi:hypothetical protein
MNFIFYLKIKSSKYYDGIKSPFLSVSFQERQVNLGFVTTANTTDKYIAEHKIRQYSNCWPLKLALQITLNYSGNGIT